MLTYMNIRDEENRSGRVLMCLMCLKMSYMLSGRSKDLGSRIVILRLLVLSIDK